jgi:hypothetical protein
VERREAIKEAEKETAGVEKKCPIILHISSGVLYRYYPALVWRY